MYGNFAGRDASRGMAKQSFELGMFTLWIDYGHIHHLPHQDMLTPVSEPLDKLTDLQPDEMYVRTLFGCPLPKTNAIWLFSDNMKGFQDLST